MSFLMFFLHNRNLTFRGRILFSINEALVIKLRQYNFFYITGETINPLQPASPHLKVKVMFDKVHFAHLILIQFCF
jgi:hypothetical protein